MEGVGWVTAGRLLQHFSTYEDLLDYPREQVLVRIKGVARAEDLVRRFFDRDQMHQLLQQAQKEHEQLGSKGISLLTPRDNRWPAGLADLPRARRPFLLYAYGAPGVLSRPVAAFFARPPLSEPCFERAQALTRHLIQADISPATGAAHGFDVVMHKIAGGNRPPHPSVLVAPCGLAQLPSKMRPTASGVVRSGGVCLSPFPMQHGPFDHDDKTRALVLAALAQASVFVEPEASTPDGEALAWCEEAGRPAFILPGEDTALPDYASLVTSQNDFRRVSSAATTRA